LAPRKRNEDMKRWKWEIAAGRGDFLPLLIGFVLLSRVDLARGAREAGEAAPVAALD